MTISNIDLENMGAQYKLPNFKVIMNNQILKEKYKPNSLYIVNLEDDNEDGSHWVSIITKNNQSCYFDSFGCVPSLQVEQFLHKSKSKYMFNNRIIQSLSSTECGLFSLGVIIYVHKHPNEDLFECVNDYVNLFYDSNTKKNDKIIQDFFQNVKHSNSEDNYEGDGFRVINRTASEITRLNLNLSAKTFLSGKLLPLIENITIGFNINRKNSGYGRSQVFGFGNIRGKGYGEFKHNTEYAELWRALLIFGKKIVPDYIPFTAIQVNHNYKTKKHIDKNNVGLSLAVSFGNFTGGELVVANTEYQTKLHPLIFNGALSEHFNNPIKGDRYSLIYFVSAPKKYTDNQIYKLHKKLINSVKQKKGEGLIGYD